MIEVLILSIIQGVTEFLPISSSSHLIIISDYLNFQEQSLSIDVSLHIGSFLAVITYFHKDIFNFVRSIRDIETSINSIKLNPTKREIENFKVVERKLFYKKDMKRGQKINYENILPLRSQSKNAYKITELPKLIGKKLKTDVKKMQPIKTENL